MKHRIIGVIGVSLLLILGVVLIFNFSHFKIAQGHFLNGDWFEFLPLVMQAGEPITPTTPSTMTETPETPAPTEPPITTTIISNVQVSASPIARYDRFDIQFDVDTTAINPYLPYDADPPAGVQAGIGVSVDALFSNDNWQTTLTQPAFYYQPFTYENHGTYNHLTPNGSPRWAVRFTPQQSGTWQYRLRATDAQGTFYYPTMGMPALSFTVSGESSNLHRRQGFLRVSAADPRYFEFQDGSYFNGVGYNDGFSNASDVETSMTLYEQNKMNLMRVWMAGAGINGSQWTSWASHHLPMDGYMPGVGLDIINTHNGADVALRLDADNPCYFADFWQGGIPVQPNTSYSISARVKLTNVTGPAESGDYGFVIKRADWLGAACSQAGNGTPITSPVVGTTDWITVTGVYNTSSGQYWFGNLYLTRQNVTGGQIYIDEVHLWKTADPNKVDLLREPYANSHLYFDPINAASWDLYIQSAETHGVYLKLVIDEKNEWIRYHIDQDTGRMDASGSADNFYAADNTKSRWLQEAWWRYIIARWGYSTAIHSFEYVNEGDPYNGNHHDIANAMAKYFHENDPSRHMVTTSFWASFPNAEFWSNTDYPNIDYADLHAYISTGWGKYAHFISDERTETNLANVRSGDASAHFSGTDNGNEAMVPRGLVIRGKGEWIVRYWMKAQNFTASCPYSGSGGMQRVRWILDGGTYYGGREGVVPFNTSGQDFVCTSPAGTFNWTQFSSDRDRNGNTIPLDYRLVISDDLPHEFSLRIENQNGTGGDAWFDDLEVVSPDGRIVPVIGTFDMSTPMDEDTAWYNRAYGDLWNGGSLVGAKMPLVRGETGIDTEEQQEYNTDILQDTEGIWLHNNLWGQISSGGMIDLFWWASETIPPSIYDNYLSYRNFMQDIPLNNGNYKDIAAQTSNSNLRAWGQRDDINGRMHLWVQNIHHTWRNVVDGVSITPISGTITIENVPLGSYQVRWWNTYQISNPVFLTQTLESDGTLTLTLPYSLTDDVGVKVDLQN